MSQHFEESHAFFMNGRSDGSGSRRAEAYLRRFTLRARRYLEIFPRREAKHAGKHIGRKLLDFRVQVADDGIVVTPGILHSVFNL